MSESERPPGKTTIAPDVLLTVARLTALQTDGISHLSPVPGRFRGLIKRGQSDGVHVTIEDGVVYVDLYLVLNNDLNIRQVSRDIQQNVSRAIVEAVGMPVGMVNIHIEDINYPTEE